MRVDGTVEERGTIARGNAAADKERGRKKIRRMGRLKRLNCFSLPTPIGAKSPQLRQELHYWSYRFGVSPEELKRAVSKAGVMADDVARTLGKLWLLNIHTPPDDVA